jgi:hypothetical protein
MSDVLLAPRDTEHLLLVLGLVPADVLAGELKLFGDGLLLDATSTGLADRLAERESRLLNLLPRSHIGTAGRYDGRHRLRHLSIMAWMWPLAMMPHFRWRRNLPRCHAT